MRAGGLGVLLLLLSLAAVADDLHSRWQEAVMHNDLAVIAAQLARIDAVDLPTSHGKTALMAAAGAGAAELVADLLQRGADSRASNRSGGTALMYAATAGAVPVIRLLLADGALLDAQASNGWTALMLAAAKDQAEVTAQLLAAGADPNLADIYAWTPLMRAVYEGHAAVAVALLADPRIELERRNDRGQTALHLAAIAGQATLAEHLLARGARAAVVDVAGRTPQSIATQRQDTALLAVLTR